MDFVLDMIMGVLEWVHGWFNPLMDSIEWWMDFMVPDPQIVSEFTLIFGPTLSASE